VAVRGVSPFEIVIAVGVVLDLVQRLAGVVRNPYYSRAWSAEKTGEGSYLVIFRVPAGTPVYAFEVSLETQSVEATFEARDRLTILRVHEDAETRLMASVY
ncbi:MAG: hypothetical protein AAB217_07895, partial [Chloroflexota bacterium]